jgi:hypothetical protein
MQINGVKTPKEKEKIGNTEKITTLETETVDYKARMEDIEIILAGTAPANMSDANVRVIGNAAITQYDRGEGTITAILDSRNLISKDRKRVEKVIKDKRPELFQ